MTTLQRTRNHSNIISFRNAILLSGLAMLLLSGEFLFGQSPSITSLSPTSGSVGTSVTITGTNFGASQGTSTVKFNSTTATPTSWSATSIVVPVPSGATSGNVSVAVGGNTSSGVAVVQSSVGTAAAGTSVSASISPSVTGHLLIAMQMMPSGSSVSSVTDNMGNSWLHATGALSSSTGDNSVIDIWYCPNCSSGVTTITAHYSATVNFSGMIAYEMSGVATSSPFEIGANLSQGAVSGSNCTGPSLTTSFTDLLIGVGDANNGFTGVSVPWVYGANQESYILNAVPGTYQPIYQVGAGSTACLASVAAFKTAAGFTVGSGGGGGSPSITSISPSTIGIGTQVTITGSGFGSTPEDVAFCDCSNGTIVSWSNTQIVAVPTAVRQNSTVSVEVGGTWTNGIPYTEIPGTITNISPTSIGIGTQVTITGSGFGSQPIDVAFCSCANATIVSWSNTQIVAIANAVAQNSSVSVEFASEEWTNGVPYTEIPATINSILPTTIGVGTQVTITGSGFGSQPRDVAFCACSNATIVSWSDTQIVAIPTAVAPNSTVSVEFASEEWTNGFPYTVFTGSSTATEYSYDSMGRVLQTMTCTPMNCGTGQGFLMSYAYDLSGDLTTLTSNGTSIQYSPADSPIDSLGHVTKIESGWVDGQHPATLATINSVSGYLPSGALQNITYGNGVTESRVYNHEIQPCRINVNSSGQLLSTCADVLPSGNIQDLNISYNETTSDNGNVIGFVASGQQNFNRSYAYDSLNRLQTMSATGDVCSGLSWTIDPWGNRTAQSVTGGSCFSGSTAVDNNNRILGDQYDAAGNLLNDGNHAYTYDAENRITQVDGGNTAKYVYDGLGQRVEKISGSDQQYLYDANGQINTVFGNGTFQRMYVYLGGKVFAEYFNNTTYFIDGDHLGSTRLLTGMDKSVQESDDYYPYGEQITAGTNDLLKFNGKERDAETGLDMYGARYYGSSFGRFVTPDWAAKPTDVPYANFGNPQSLNLYSYVENNPTTLGDPDGHEQSGAGSNEYDVRRKGYLGADDGQSQTQTATSKGTSVIISTFDVKKLTFSVETRTGTHAFRDNNPGNIRDGNFAQKNGAIGKDGGFAIFPTSATGFKALGNLLGGSSYQSLTVDQAIDRYAPPSENDTATYQSTIRNAVGVSGNTPMSSLSSGQMGSMEHGIAQHEGFYVPGSTSTQTIDLNVVIHAIN